MVKKSRRKKDKLLNAVLIVWFIVFFILFAFSGYKFLMWLRDNNDTKEKIEEIDDTNIDEVPEEDTELVNEDNDKTSDYWYYITFPLIDVDINSLKQKNSDTVGWINVNNTNINYPFVQTSLLKNQILNLVEENEGVNILLKQNNRSIGKDKFSAFMYGLYFAKFLEEKSKKRHSRDISKFLFMN